MNLFRPVWIRDVEHAAFAIAKAADEQGAIVGAQADVHRQDAGLAAKGCHLLRLPCPVRVLVTQPDL